MRKYTNEQYTQLHDAYSQGILTVKFADKLVTYRNLNEMKELLSEMELSLGLRKKHITKKFTSFTKGM
ncbi:hypothetical protein LX64_04166 [Chitinophaga skermanii]|uniref:Uncharacterized protein n=1 Tax=Chitinophaga skermanii TaxID=331697 RepID=A0A327Q7T1_9BACT|nr:hypothetical protein [Chitinophaga skermanii]RAJ00460.1 hypothetical protein LX64_04166 [Chitinophaga skermanii]